MIKLRPGTRLFRDLNNIRNNQYTLINPFIKFNSTINLQAAKLLFLIKRYSENQVNEKKINKLINENHTFIDSLKKYGILIEDDNEMNNDYPITFIKSKSKLPLTCLNIELTNGCNLSCIHCYGKFGNNTKPIFIDTKKLISLIPQLNNLNCKAISFTGGESTIHPDFLEIVESFMKHGFQITIFTNAFKHDKIIDLVTKYKEYPFTFKISLDGKKETHDYIRGRKGSYDSVIELLDFLNQFENLKVHLSCTVMKNNIGEVQKFKEFIVNKYPRFNFDMNLIFSLCDNCEESFNVNEFDFVYDNCRSLFSLPSAKEKKHRCTGGISQCTLMPDGRLKICNGASHPSFYFKNNVFKVGLKRAWLDCGKNIKYFRKEKNKDTKECNNCKMKSVCTMTDCRLLALAYKKDYKANNPFVCYATEKNINNLNNN